LALALAVLGMLAGCAGLSVGRATHSAARTQPLQRLEVPPTAPDQDVLTLSLAAEFALADADLESAAHGYAQAA
jgi:hypothetical protein